MRKSYNNNQKFRVLTLKEFLEELNNSGSSLQKWTKELENSLLAVDDKELRQRVLRFGVIVAALIDHFDPDYKTVRRREVYTNKLSPKSKKIIRTHLINHYLPFISKKDRYYE